MQRSEIRALVSASPAVPRSASLHAGYLLTRSDRPGSDFRDYLGTTWDVIGSNVSDRNFRYGDFVERLQSKLDYRAADRIAVDLTGLGQQSAAMVRDLGRLPPSLRAYTRILRSEP